jgi:hypothetical protein
MIGTLKRAIKSQLKLITVAELIRYRLAQANQMSLGPGSQGPLELMLCNPQIPLQSPESGDDKKN